MQTFSLYGSDSSEGAGDTNRNSIPRSGLARVAAAAPAPPLELRKSSNQNKEQSSGAGVSVSAKNARTIARRRSGRKRELAHKRWEEFRHRRTQQLIKEGMPIRLANSAAAKEWKEMDTEQRKEASGIGVGGEEGAEVKLEVCEEEDNVDADEDFYIGKPDKNKNNFMPVEVKTGPVAPTSMPTPIPISTAIAIASPKPEKADQQIAVFSKEEITELVFAIHNFHERTKYFLEGELEQMYKGMVDYTHAAPKWNKTSYQLFHMLRSRQIRTSSTYSHNKSFSKAGQDWNKMGEGHRNIFTDFVEVLKIASAAQASQTKSASLKAMFYALKVGSRVPKLVDDVKNFHNVGHNSSNNNDSSLSFPESKKPKKTKFEEENKCKKIQQTPTNSNDVINKEIVNIDRNNINNINDCDDDVIVAYSAMNSPVPPPFLMKRVSYNEVCEEVEKEMLFAIEVLQRQNSLDEEDGNSEFRRIARKACVYLFDEDGADQRQANDEIDFEN